MGTIDIDDIIKRLILHLKAEEYKGYDPYDALNSFIPYKFFGHKAQVIAIQLQLRNPINLRKFIGIKKEYKFTGINSILMVRMMCNIVEDGILKIESNPMLETNFSIQQNWKFAENEIIKKRQTYKRTIKNG